MVGVSQETDFLIPTHVSSPGCGHCRGGLHSFMVFFPQFSWCLMLVRNSVSPSQDFVMKAVGEAPGTRRRPTLSPRSWGLEPLPESHSSQSRLDVFLGSQFPGGSGQGSSYPSSTHMPGYRPSHPRLLSVTNVILLVN